MTISSRKVQVVSAVDAVADELRRRVLDGSYAPGAALREVALSEELGVGRHTLRAALGTLAHEGLLVREAHRGVFVPVLSATDVRDLFTVRAALEVEAARIIATDRITPVEAIERLRVMDMLPQDVAWSDIVDADLALHAALVGAVGSERMSGVYRTLAVEIRLCISQLRPFYASPAVLVAEHRALLDAITSGDADAGVAEVRAHLARAVRDLTRRQS